MEAKFSYILSYNSQKLRHAYKLHLATVSTGRYIFCQVSKYY